MNIVADASFETAAAPIGWFSTPGAGRALTVTATGTATMLAFRSLEGFLPCGTVLDDVRVI